ncbi:MAG: polysaccharide deacetylase family protein [Candidatus Rokubacteria bacterium]|nr:polysaccharide deacetylase family protein [Candidatus Rokubacteria bacterium]
MSRSAAPIVNAFTVDVEDWYCNHFLEGRVPPSAWDRQPSVVRQGTEAILSLLAEYGIRATFFVLGYVADRFPELCQAIRARGHAIGTHGYWHHRPLAGTPDQFQRDLRESIGTIARATGTLPLGYRAPVAALDWPATWAFQAMRDAGIVYDSSVYPTRLFVLAGSADAPRAPFLTATGVWEIPLSVAEVCGRRFPLSGGFYLRALPFGLYRRLIRRENAAGRPVILYVHPWELAHGFPRLMRHPIGRLVQTWNLRSVESKLRALFEEFRWGAIEDVYRQVLAVPSPAAELPASRGAA